MYKIGNKCEYSRIMLIFKPDDNNGLSSCACANKLHMEDEFQSYVLSFLIGLRQGSPLSVPPFLYATIPFNVNCV